MYNINWRQFVHDNIFAATRKPIFIAWLRAILSPIEQIHAWLLAYRGDVIERISITPQVRIMRYYLNEYFDPSERRFDIVDGPNDRPLFVFLASENRPVYLPEFTILSDYDFRVIAPVSAQVQEVQVRAFLNTYKLAGKRYFISWLSDPQIEIEREPTGDDNVQTQ